MDETAVQSAHGLVYGDAVVVEYHEYVRLADRHVVEGFESLTAGHRAVADDGNMLTAAFALQLRGYRHTQSGGDGGGGVAGAEGVVLALAHLWKSTQSPFGSDRGELISPSGDNFVGVCLMAHIPYQLVVGGVEDIMQSHGQLHHAQ